mmetsp:Transcript_22623/g.36029  ORF Transcript_22623/g.36029 Transcript_22623/m.36029 type:complete len:576 (-) Transcript_22623:1368-3095(-)
MAGTGDRADIFETLSLQTRAGSDGATRPKDHTMGAQRGSTEGRAEINEALSLQTETGGDGAINQPVDNVRVESDDQEAAFSCGPCSFKQKTYQLALMTLIIVFLFADMNLLAPVLTPIAREFGFVEKYPNGTVVMEYDTRLQEWLPKVDAHMRDQKLGGDITLAFFVIGGVVSLSVGWLADTVNRVMTLAVVVLFGETACLCTYFTTTYSGLFITRALTGISLGGAIPLIFSICGDLFTIRQRGKAISAVGFAVSAGGGIGQVLAGPIAGKDGSNWRLPFLIVALPTYILAALLIFTVKEPARGTKEEAVMDSADADVGYSEKITLKTFMQLMKTPSVILIFLQGIPGSLPWGIFNMYLSDYLTQERGISIQLTGFVITTFGLGVTAGTIIAGFMVDRLFRTPYRCWIPVIIGILTALGCVPMAIFIDLKIGFVATMVYVVLPGVLLGFAGNTTKVLLVNVTVPETRGTAFSILNLFDDLGRGAGIFFLAKFFSLFHASPGKTARAKGMQAGFVIGWTLCGLCIAMMYFTLDRDYKRAQASVGANVAASRAIVDHCDLEADKKTKNSCRFHDSYR